jgi:hypothetical protein
VKKKKNETGMHRPLQQPVLFQNDFSLLMLFLGVLSTLALKCVQCTIHVVTLEQAAIFAFAAASIKIAATHSRCP